MVLRPVFRSYKLYRTLSKDSFNSLATKSHFVSMYFSRRLEQLSANVFADMDRAKAAAVAAGQDIIDLSLGSADLPASLFI